MQRAMPEDRAIPQQGQIDEAIIIVEKTGLTIVAPLHHVQRDVRHDQPREPPHGRRTAQPARSLTE